MKFIFTVILTALFSFLCSLYLPWWCIAPVSFIVALVIPQKPGIALLSGFLALFLLWGGLAWMISLQNEHILAKKMAMLILQKNQPMLMVLITATIGGLIAGLSSLAAAVLVPVFKK
ncbi:MAG: hypothetical protein ACKO5C_06365 [Ferruginibacter sp.]